MGIQDHQWSFLNIFPWHTRIGDKVIMKEVEKVGGGEVMNVGKCRVKTVGTKVEGRGWWTGGKRGRIENERRRSINEGGVKGGNVYWSTLLQDPAVNWFEPTQMFAFCLRPKHTFLRSALPPHTAQNFIDCTAAACFFCFTLNILTCLNWGD